MNATGLPDMSMDEILRRWPATLGVLIDLEMHCIGCPIAVFHTSAEAAAEHGLPVDVLLVELGRAIAGTRTRASRGDVLRRSETSGAHRAPAASAVRPSRGRPAPRG